MPVKIPDQLPARAVLERENIFVMTRDRALHQDIRPLRLLILNLMPDKTTAETSLLRCLSNTPLQIEVDFIHTATYTPTHTDPGYLAAFYRTFDAVRRENYDGMIITGAPVETRAFEEVAYWPELCEIMDWAVGHVYSTLFICWGAQAGLYHHYGVEKYPLSQKTFGVFMHDVLDQTVPLFRGFDDRFAAPHSRHTQVLAEDIRALPALTLLSTSDEAGVYVVTAREGRQVFVLGHPEYEADALAREYARDAALGLPVEPPRHYYPGDDPSRPPAVRWRSHATLLYTNWLNYYVYQATPYDLSQITS